MKFLLNRFLLLSRFQFSSDFITPDFLVFFVINCSRTKFEAVIINVSFCNFLLACFCDFILEYSLTAHVTFSRFYIFG